MGVAGWRSAHRKTVGGRAAVIAVLEELPVICSMVVCGRLDDHDGDHALQGLAAVKGRKSKRFCARQTPPRYAGK